MSENVINMTRRSDKKSTEPLLPLKKAKFIDAVRSVKAREKIVADLVDRLRSLTSHQCKYDFWCARLKFFERTARSEGATDQQIRSAIQILTHDVRIENENRTAMAISAAEYDLPVDGWEVEQVMPGEVLKFPGQEDGPALPLPRGFA